VEEVVIKHVDAEKQWVQLTVHGQKWKELNQHLVQENQEL
jgi:hypothetical protein